MIGFLMKFITKRIYLPGFFLLLAWFCNPVFAGTVTTQLTVSAQIIDNCSVLLPERAKGKGSKIRPSVICQSSSTPYTLETQVIDASYSENITESTATLENITLSDTSSSLTTVTVYY